MKSEDKRFKLSHNGVGSNPTAAKDPSTSLLESALENPIRKRYGFNVLFAGLDKAPTLLWKKWEKEPQSDEDVQAYYNGMGAGNVTCWGFVTGYKNLEGIDFDWAWVYRLWKTKFGARVETLTLQTPNGGLRPHFLCEKPETVDKFKESLHVELKGPGRFVVYEGKAGREDGSADEYKVVMDKPIREDNNIIADTLAWFEEIEKRCRFLRWNCIHPHFKRKVLDSPPHEVHLYVADVMACEGFSYEEIYSLFRDFSDFDHTKTDYQIRYTLDRVKAGLKPPSCETLRQTLGWSEDGCNGCLRRGAAKREEGIALGDYRLTVKGKKVYLYDKAGQLRWSGKIQSIDGPRAKKNLQEITECEEKEVDRAVAALSFSAQPKGKEQETQTSGETLKPPKETNPEVAGEAEKLLEDPALLFHVNKALDSKLCGELENRLFMFKAACGARCKTLMIRLEGPNAAGKKMLYYWLPEFFGEENVVIMTGATFPYWKRKALEGWDSRGKIIVLVEERGDYAGATKYTFGQVYSEDKIVLGMNVRNEEGEWEPVDITLQGPLLFITSSTEPESSSHEASREWTVTPDDSKEQTQKVDEWWREREMLPKPEIEEENRQIRVVRHAMSLLEPYEVKIPFIKNIQFPLEFLADRRKARDFDNLIKYSGFVHQRIRPVVDGVIYALPHDYYIAEKIGRRVLEVSRGALTRNEENLLKYIRNHPELAKFTEDGKLPVKGQEPTCFRVADVANTDEYRYTPESTLRSWLNSLARKKVLIKRTVSRRNVVYRNLNADSSVGARAINVSPVSLKDYISALSLSFNKTPEEMGVVVARVKELWKQPIVDPITGDRVTLSETTTAHIPRDALLKLGTKPKKGSSAEEKPKDIARVASELSAQTSPENTLKSEVLPKSLRVPLGLEDYMATVKLGKEWHVRCLLCARQGKQFYTVNTRDMIIHIQRVHQQLLPLISEMKSEETKETEPEENTPRSRSVARMPEE